jgi:hypothetical protein
MLQSNDLRCHTRPADAQESGNTQTSMIAGAAGVQSEGSTFSGPMENEDAGDLVASGSTFNGTLDTRGAGEYVDQGGNTWARH